MIAIDRTAVSSVVALTLICTIAAAPKPASAAEDGESWRLAMPSLEFFLPRRSWLSLVRFGRWGLEARVDSEWDRNEISSAASDDARFERSAFTERIDMRGAGYVYDPRLMKFRMGLSLGFFQELFESQNDKGENDGDLLGFDGEVTLLDGLAYNARAFGSRAKDTATREFSGTTEVLVENLGTELRLKKAPLQSLVGYRRQRLRERLRSSDSTSERDETREIASYRGERPGAVSDIALDYEYQNVRDRNASSLNFDAHDASVYLRRYFGDYLEKDVRSRLRVFHRQGRIDTFNGKGDVTLNVDHTDNFRTLWDYGYHFHDTGGDRTQSHQGSVGARHRLYGSLVSSVRGFGNYSQFEAGNSLGYGGRGELNYTKRLPAEGRFQVDVSISYRIDDQRQPGGFSTVFGETHTVDDFERIPLEGESIFPESVVITDVTGTVIYDLGFDYDLFEVGSTLAIERLPGGRLTDGQSVLVDYRHASAEDFEFSTRVQRGDFTLDYPWVTLYVRHRLGDQDLLSGEGGAFLDDTEDIVAGVRLHHGTRAWTGNLTAEYRSHDSRRTDFTSPTVRQALSWRPARNLTFDFNASQTFASFRDPDRETTTILGRLTARWRPRAYADVELFAGYFDRADSLSARERFTDAGVRLRFEFGRLSIRPSFLVTHREIGSGDSLRLHGSIDLVRRFL